MGWMGLLLMMTSIGWMMDVGADRCSIRTMTVCMHFHCCTTGINRCCILYSSIFQGMLLLTTMYNSSRVAM